MHAYATQFNESILDLDFIVSINPFTSDKLLYINIMAGRLLRDCLQYPMVEEQQFSYATLQDRLLDAVECTYNSAVVTHDKEEHMKNSLELFDIVKSILEFSNQLKATDAAARCRPHVVMIGPWPREDMFFPL